MYTNYPHEYKITYDDRRQNIVNFIKENEGCTKTEVIKDAESRDYGSKKVILGLIGDLVAEEIVMIDKPKLNPREHRLKINRENPILNLQKQLSDIDGMLNALFYKSKENLFEIIKSRKRVVEFSKGDVDSLCSISFITVGIIEHAFAYHYKIIWLNNSPNIVEQLYTAFFIQLGNWYKLVNHYSTDLIESYNYLDSHDQKVIKHGTPGKYFLWFKTPQQSFDFKYGKELYIKLNLPLWQIHSNQYFFEQLNVLPEYSKLIDYLFRINVNYLDSIYPEIYGKYGEILPIEQIDHSYLDIYIKKFKELVEEKNRQKI